MGISRECDDQRKVWKIKNKVKISKQLKKWRIKNKDKIKKDKAKYYQENRVYVDQRMKDNRTKNIGQYLSREARYRKDNAIIIRKQQNKSLKKNCDILSDGYVCAVICNKTNLKSKDVPPELIELKRNAIITHRLIKERRCQLNGTN